MILLLQTQEKKNWRQQHNKSYGVWYQKVCIMSNLVKNDDALTSTLYSMRT